MDGKGNHGPGDNLEGKVNTLETRMQNTATSQRDITSLSEKIAVLLSYTVQHFDFTARILYFLTDIGTGRGEPPTSPNQFLQTFHKWFKLRKIHSQEENFRKCERDFIKIPESFN